MTVKELMNILKDCDEKAEIKIENWDGLGFVLQWAKYGLKK